MKNQKARRMEKARVKPKPKSKPDGRYVVNPIKVTLGDLWPNKEVSRM